MKAPKLTAEQQAHRISAVVRLDTQHSMTLLSHIWHSGLPGDEMRDLHTGATFLIEAHRDPELRKELIKLIRRVWPAEGQK